VRQTDRASDVAEERRATSEYDDRSLSAYLLMMSRPSNVLFNDKSEKRTQNSPCGRYSPVIIIPTGNGSRVKQLASAKNHFCLLIGNKSI
jgi:hypothetical protein